MSEAIASSLGQHLFGDLSERGYAILDGASVPELLGSLERWSPRWQCLFSGALAPSEKQTAPYLVELAPDSAFTSWVLEEGWGNHWGIFLRAAGDPRQIRRHLRTILRARIPDGRELLFRFYDPRVMRVYLPTCNAAECEQVFGPISWIGMEGEEGELLTFTPGPGGPQS